MLAIRQFLSQRLHAETLQPDRIHSMLAARDALADESRYHEAMIAFLGRACRIATAGADALHRQFTAILWGILFVLCGLALTAVVAW
ncbi:hypothetical protein Q5424_20725 [Conexibacter sp. JD483]|uniref:hypothetical protein n=1 Tax=unclassified Conexibacter TaxID=2627773 RepID=UPI0027250BB9|nr:MULTISPECIES: hypothetical protein [unclassified Conexibacter]MDO8185558.1 hypothetical protein [Conexibacter sp. CPCC 205706]MDO8197255.1 hypothetical protein [Conexibacter sp. CPCC 205762]MDR9371536.1 hypothetical protein [Conexibacter sp. JD483]